MMKRGESSSLYHFIGGCKKSGSIDFATPRVALYKRLAKRTATFFTSSYTIRFLTNKLDMENGYGSERDCLKK